MADATDLKLELVQQLQWARDAVLWKLDGLPEHDVRRPLTRTGTNLLGIVQHLACWELAYFGDTFGRPHGVQLPWDAPGHDPNDDLWVGPDDSRSDVVGLYRAAWAHAAETFDAHDLGDTGTVPWWPEGQQRVTLHQMLVHVLVDTARHAGHADILREDLDGAIGRSRGFDALPDAAYDWAAHRDRVERAAVAATEASS